MEKYRIVKISEEEKALNLLDMILNADNSPLIREAAQRFGMGEDDARNAIGQMVPALSRGISRNVSQPGGMEALLNALASGDHRRYVENPEELANPETIRDGNSILGHILGSKDVSRNVAGHAAAQTGIDAGILKQMLPMVAAMAMGMLGKQFSRAGSELAPREGEGSSPGLPGLLGTLLGSNQDGYLMDDLLGLAKKFF